MILEASSKAWNQIAVFYNGNTLKPFFSKRLIVFIITKSEFSVK